MFGAAPCAPVPIGKGHVIPVVIVVHVLGDAELLLVAGAGRFQSLVLGHGQGGQQQRGQNGDDSNDHQKFNERECAWPVFNPICLRGRVSFHECAFVNG
jgi:hypothetical protein